MKTLKIIVVGGGTGGHIQPALWVADELIKRGHHIWFVTDQPEVIRSSGISQKVAVIEVHSGKLMRTLKPQYLIKTITGFVRTILAVFEMYRLLRKVRPDRIFNKGGYIGFPVGLAAHWLNIPMIIHESDAVVGLTNRSLLPWATKLAVGFPIFNYPVGGKTKMVYTGVPLDPQFTPTPLPDKGRSWLIIGGSQGAEPVNRLVLAILPLVKCPVLITWVTGPTNYETTKERLSNIHIGKDVKVKLVAYASNVPTLMKRSTLVIGRSSSVIMEMAAVGRPAVLVPFADSAGNHQQKNADILADRNSAVVVSQLAKPQEFLEAILRADKKMTGYKLARAIKSFYKKDSTQVIAELVERGK